MKPLRTKAARIYSDIIEKSRPEDEDSRIRHPRMPIPDRAAIPGCPSRTGPRSLRLLPP